MTSVFYLLPELGLCPEAAALGVLAFGLPQDRFRLVVGVLGPANGPFAEALFDAGASIHSVPVRHAFDLSGIRRLRQVVRESKVDIVHALGPRAARAARLVVSRRGDAGNTPRLIASGAATPGRNFGGWLATRQLRRADRVIAATWAEGERYRRLGVGGDLLARILPAAPKVVPPTDRDALFDRLGVPRGSRLVVTTGRSDRGTGPKDAIVAFDMLRYDRPDLYLVMFGAGADAVALAEFGQSLAFDDFRIRFPLNAADRASAVALASVVWVTQVRDGIDEALEAMAAGKPVVAWANADLTEIVEDGVSGFLVPVGDRAALAANTRVLLEDPATAAYKGEAGRARAAGRFPAARMVEQFARVYAELIAD